MQEQYETWIGQFLVGSLISFFNPVAWFWVAVWFAVGIWLGAVIF